MNNTPITGGMEEEKNGEKKFRVNLRSHSPPMRKRKGAWCYRKKASQKGGTKWTLGWGRKKGVNWKQQWDHSQREKATKLSPKG